jgi:hypothetical protein
MVSVVRRAGDAIVVSKIAYNAFSRGARRGTVVKINWEQAVALRFNASAAGY